MEDDALQGTKGDGLRRGKLEAGARKIILWLHHVNLLHFLLCLLHTRSHMQHSIHFTMFHCTLLFPLNGRHASLKTTGNNIGLLYSQRQLLFYTWRLQHDSMSTIQLYGWYTAVIKAQASLDNIMLMQRHLPVSQLFSVLDYNLIQVFDIIWSHWMPFVSNAMLVVLR